jgi:hypothetical protein
MSDSKEQDERYESPLARWSARKARARAQTESSQPPTVPLPLAPQRELTDADMPPLETIDQNTDMRGFFSPQVGAELRRLALRKLFQLPAYNVRDGLDDYAEDFTQFAKLGDIVTADMRYMQEVKERLLAEAREKAVPADEPSEDTQPLEAPAQDSEDQPT